MIGNGGNDTFNISNFKSTSAVNSIATIAGTVVDSLPADANAQVFTFSNTTLTSTDAGAPYNTFNLNGITRQKLTGNSTTTNTFNDNGWTVTDDGWSCRQPANTLNATGNGTLFLTNSLLQANSAT